MRIIISLLSSAMIWSLANAEEPMTATAAKSSSAVLQKNVQQIPAGSSKAAAKAVEDTTQIATQPVKDTVAPVKKPETPAVTKTAQAVVKTATPIAAPEKKSGISVAKALIAETSSATEPGDATEFPGTIKRLYCISQIKGARDSIEIQHRWYCNDNLVATVPLMIRSANWRTYSAKTILPNMTGDWRVAIVDGQKDEVLQTVKFTVK